MDEIAQKAREGMLVDNPNSIYDKHNQSENSNMKADLFIKKNRQSESTTRIDHDNIRRHMVSFMAAHYEAERSREQKRRVFVWLNV